MLKNWLKQHKAAPALDFPYFQSVSILAVQDRKPLISQEISGFSNLLARNTRRDAIPFLG